MCVANPEVAEKPTTEVKAEDVSAIVNKEMQAFDASYSEFMKKVRAEKDRKKAVALYQKAPKATECIKRILDIAERHPKEKASQKALSWTLRRARTQENRERISKMFLTHYINDDAINAYSQSLSRSYDPKAADSLRKIASTTTREDNKIYANYYLASKLKNDSSRNPRLSAEQRKAIADESIALYKKLNTNPKVAELNPKLAKQIGSVIFELENLAIGCKAPEIEGDDHTGTKFKLSDYKGKVVLLDFWGNW